MFSIPKPSDFFGSPKSPMPKFKDFSDFTLELSQISEIEQIPFSPLNSSINDSKFEYFKTSPSVKSFKVRESFIAGLLSQELTLQKALNESSLKVKQLEIDLNFYIEQFRIANEENLALQSLLIEKDKIIDELVAESGKISKDYQEKKLFLKEFCEYGLDRVEFLGDQGTKEDIQDCKDKTQDFSHIILENHSEFKNNSKNFEKSPENLKKNCKEYSYSHFSPPSSKNKEFFKLLKENENLKIEICELENQMKKKDFFIINELKLELKVDDSEALIRRVLYLQEYFHQTKEIFPVYSQISSIISKAMGRSVTESVIILQTIKSKFLPQG